MTHKPWLVVVRAGDRSLHETWLKPEKYDVIVAYYGDDKNKWQRDEITRLEVKGGKWDGLYRVISAHPELLDKYRAIWLPDDDIEATPEAVEKMFSLHERYDLKLSQPTLTPDSYFSHFCLLHNPSFRLRYSNFIEIMMPCMSSDLLRRALPYFENNKTGNMLDKVWHRLTAHPAYASAILDEAQMRHTQPVDQGALDKSSRAQDIEPLAHLLPKRSQRRPLLYGGILVNGEKITGERSVAWPMFCGWHKIKRQIRYAPRNPLALLLKQTRYQLTRRADLTPLL